MQQVLVTLLLFCLVQACLMQIAIYLLYTVLIATIHTYTDTYMHPFRKQHICQICYKRLTLLRTDAFAMLCAYQFCGSPSTQCTKAVDVISV